MKQRLIFLIMLTCITYSFSVQTQSYESGITDAKNIEHRSILAKNTHLALYTSFSNFLQSFVALLHTDTIKNNIQSVETMLTNLIQTSFHIEKSNKTRSILYKDGSVRIEFIDNKDQEIFVDLLIREFKQSTLKKSNNAQQQANRPQQKKDDDNQLIILGYFARIAQNFFSIVQEPESRENVIPNLLGMLSGVVHIGAEVIKRSNLHLDSDLQDIKAYIEELDVEFKTDILSVLAQQTEVH